MMKKKITKGRQKIAIEKIACEEARHVCFSKRKNGIFTKATDLTTLCGAEVAILINSPAGNQVQSSSNINKIRYLNQQCMEISSYQVQANSRKLMLEEHINELLEKNPICKIAEEPEGLGVDHLMQVAHAINSVKMRAKERIEQLAQFPGISSSNTAIVVNPSVNQYSITPAGPTFFPDNFGQGGVYP